MDPNQVNIPPQQTYSTPTPSHKGISLISVFFIVFIVLAIGLVGGYFLGQSKVGNTPQTNQQTKQIIPTPTIIPTTVVSVEPTSQSNLNTYVNNQFGLSFQYPLDWKTVIPFPGSPNSPAFIGLTPVNKDLGSSASPIYVEHWDNPKNLSLQDFDKEYNSTSPMGQEFYSSTATMTMVGGYTAYIKENAACDPLYCTRVTIMAKNNILIFFNQQNNQQFSPSELAVNKGIFNNILSTVKFNK